MVGEPLFSVAVITLGLEIVLRVFSIDAVKIQFRSLAVPWGNNVVRRRRRRSSTGRTSRRWSPPRSRSSPCTSSTARAWGSRCGRSPKTRKRRWRRASTSGSVFAIAWAAGAALATLGSIFAVQPPVKQTGSVDQETVFIAFRALPAVILGGLDSVQGALVGGLIVGLAEIFAGQYLSSYTRHPRRRLPGDRALRRDDHRSVRQTVRPVRHARDPEGVSDVPPARTSTRRTSPNRRCCRR